MQGRTAQAVTVLNGDDCRNHIGVISLKLKGQRIEPARLRFNIRMNHCKMRRPHLAHIQGRAPAAVKAIVKKRDAWRHVAYDLAGAVRRPAEHGSDGFKAGPTSIAGHRDNNARLLW